MNTIKRWTTTLVSRFDTVMKQVENHEAIISSTIKETQSAAAKARVRYNRLIADGKTMDRRLQSLQEAEDQWAERALKMHESDKDKAIECVRRRNRARTEAEQLRSEIDEHKLIEKRLAADMRTIEVRIADLKIKRNNFSAREYRAQAMNASETSEGEGINNLDDIFERWEIKLTESEFNDTASSDVFEHEFHESEELRDIESDLDDLISQSKQS